MNYNTSSNNFSTVFFLVVVFIATGLLLYHAVDVSAENGRLKDSVAVLKATSETLGRENAALKNENAAVAGENDRLRVENQALKAVDADKLAELEKLRSENNALKLENQRLQTLQGSTASSEPQAVVLQSSLLPTDPDFWLKVLVGVLAGAVILIGYTYYALLAGMRRRKAAVKPARSRPQAARTNKDSVVDSYFIERY